MRRRHSSFHDVNVNKMIVGALIVGLVATQDACGNDCCIAIRAWNSLQGTQNEDSQDCCQSPGIECSEDIVTEIHWGSTDS